MGGSEAEMALQGRPELRRGRCAFELSVERHWVQASSLGRKVNLDKTATSCGGKFVEGTHYELSAGNIPRNGGNSCLVPAAGDLGGTPVSTAKDYNMTMQSVIRHHDAITKVQMYQKEHSEGGRIIFDGEKWKLPEEVEVPESKAPNPYSKRRAEVMESHIPSWQRWMEQ